MSLQLTPKEVNAIQMALTTMIEDVSAMSKDPAHNWTKEAKEIYLDILVTAKSALDKIATTSGHRVQLDPYKEGDEKEFLKPKS